MSEKYVKRYIDPITDIQNQKSEFRLDGDAWRSNLKLVMAFKQAGNTKYNQLAGAYGGIRHIRLMSGGVEVDSCRFANYYMAFKNVLQKNEDNVGYRSKLSKAAVGFQIDALLTFGARNIDTMANVAGSDGVSGAVLHLSEILPILRNVEIFNTMLFPDLRVVIEYNTDDKLIADRIANVADSQPPIMIAEEVMDQQMVKSSMGFKGVLWTTIESDQVIIPAKLDAGVQSVTRKVNGFDGKKCDRIVMMKHLFPISKNYTGTVPNAFGTYSSYVQNLEEVNFNLNGKPVFPNSGGLKDSGEKSMVLHDTWGPVNIIPYGNQSGTGSFLGRDTNIPVGEPANYGVPQIPNVAAARISTKVGAQDYIGLSLADHVNNLELEFSRTTVVDNRTIKPQNESLQIRMFAEVRKQLVVSNGKILVSYQ